MPFLPYHVSKPKHKHNTMTKVETDILGTTVSVDVPSTVEEYNALDTSRPSAVLADAVNNTLQHSWKGEVRDKAAALVEEELGFKRAMKPGAVKKSGEAGAEVPAETVKDYFDRALSEGKATEEQLATILIKAASSTPFDPSPGERSGGSGRIGKEYYAAADGIISQGPDVVKKAVKKLEKLNAGVSVKFNEDGSVSRDSFASAIRTNAARKVAEASAELIG